MIVRVNQARQNEGTVCVDHRVAWTRRFANCANARTKPDRAERLHINQRDDPAPDHGRGRSVLTAWKTASTGRERRLMGSFGSRVGPTHKAPGAGAGRGALLGWGPAR